MRIDRIGVFATLFLSPLLMAQETSQIGGTVKDTQGAVIPAAPVEVVGVETNTHFSTKTDPRGEYLVPSLPTAIYRVSVSLKGFQTAVVDGVKLEPGAPATVNVTLRVGNINESVEVSSGAEVLQTETTSVTTNLEGAQINELPVASRNANELLTLLPGTNSPGTMRTSSIDGLPKSSLNMTLDGASMHDPYLRSSDGFFASLQAKPDAVEEVVVTTSGASADMLGQGAVQVRFVTKSGTNRFHGTLFWQNRNDFFDANYYFNNIDGLPRDRINLNQFGGSLGGPVIKNKLFFFFNQEWFKLPQTTNSGQILIPTATAITGIFTYADGTGAKHAINLYNVAALGNATLPASIRPYATTPDPSMLSTLQDMVRLASPTTGALTSRVASAGDYNRNYYNFQTPGQNNRSFPTAHLDWVATANHHLDVVGNYQTYFANPDTVNGTIPILPGTGSVLGSPQTGSSRRITHSLSAALRSAWTPRLTSELRFSTQGGPVDFWQEQTPAQFARWNGYAPIMAGSYIANPWTSGNATPGSVRRDTPVETTRANFTFVGGPHTLTFGGSYNQTDHFEQSISTDQIPTVTLGVATGDPINTGTTGIFTSTNFPSSTSQQRTDAMDLYAILTGRVSSIARSLSIDQNTHNYSTNGAVDRTRERYLGFYIHDNWRLAHNLTVNYGVRWDIAFPFEDLRGLYTSSGYAGSWGPSGIGNLFDPGATGGSPTVFNLVKPGQTGFPNNYHFFLPSIGLAYALPEAPGFLRRLTGPAGKTVFRSGYSISGVQDGMAVFRYVWGSNPGRSTNLSLDPTNFPPIFGQAGSVWLRDPSLPAQTVPSTPTFPIPLAANQTINEFDPGLRQPYVQSWSAGVQREIFHETVLEIRYVGNHSVGLWRLENLNETNIFENGFLNQFKIAQQNLAIAQAKTPSSVNFGNQGLPGQANVPILSTALGTSTDTTTATYLERGEAGASAYAIATNATRMANLVKAGYPFNFFRVNPYTNAADYLLTNGGASTYNALQVELRKRLAKGLLLQGNYVWGKALTNMNASSEDDLSEPQTLRNTGLSKGASPWDIRQSFKFNYIYELPWGPGHTLFGRTNHLLARKLAEGWQLAGSTILETGSPALLRSGRETVNGNDNISASADAGVVLHNITAQQLQNLVSIRKSPNGIVYFLPQDLIDNSLAAFDEGGKTVANLNPTQPYIGPPTTPGVFGERIYLYGPMRSNVNLSLIKRTRVGEKKTLELRCNMLNAFNDVNFLLGSAANDVNSMTLASSTFGQTRSAFRDFSTSGANVPGGRVIDFLLRFSF
jgi:hypothetical protein